MSARQETVEPSLALAIVLKSKLSSCSACLAYDLIELGLLCVRHRVSDVSSILFRRLFSSCSASYDGASVPLGTVLYSRECRQFIDLLLRSTYGARTPFTTTASRSHVACNPRDIHVRQGTSLSQRMCFETHLLHERVAL